jgi:hypothetical protein
MKKIFYLCVILVLTACSTQKSRNQQLLTTLEKSKQASLIKDSLQMKSSIINATHQQIKEGMLLEMDELFYWHPDSGLKQKPGFVKVKVYKSSSKDSLVQQNRISQRNTVKAHEQEQEFINKSKSKVLEKEVERKGSLIIFILLALIIFIGIRLRFKY